jgi:hypothetical protein
MVAGDGIEPSSLAYETRMVIQTTYPQFKLIPYSLVAITQTEVEEFIG